MLCGHIWRCCRRRCRWTHFVGPESRAGGHVRRWRAHKTLNPVFVTGWVVLDALRQLAMGLLREQTTKLKPDVISYNAAISACEIGSTIEATSVHW